MKCKVLILLTLALLLLGSAACSVRQSNNGDEVIPQKDKEDQKNTESIVSARATEVLGWIKAKDMAKLSQTVHPDKGVRFSPYAYVNTETNLVFTADQIRKLPSDEKVYVWGSYDGSGEPIELSFADYYNKFVYDKDFLHAKEIGYNKILGKGNSLINISEVYPEAKFVEYHFPGFEPKYQGMDWESLRLVFEKKNSVWYLVGIIHDQWTI